MLEKKFQTINTVWKQLQQTHINFCISSEDGETSWGQIDDQDLRRGRRQSRRRVRGAGGGGRAPCVCPGAAVAAAAARGILSFSMRVRTLGCDNSNAVSFLR